MLGASLQQRGGIAAVERLIIKHLSPKIELHHITTHDEGSIAHRIMVFFIAVVKLLFVLLSMDINLVHIHISERGSVVRKMTLIVICFVFRKPVLLHTHGAEFHLFYEKLNLYARKLICLIFAKCRGIIVLSKNWREFFIDKLSLKKNKIFLLYNPVEIPLRRHEAKRTKKQIQFVFMGRIGYRKGAFDVLKAFWRLPIELRQRSNIVLAGDGDIRNGQEMIRRLKLGNRIFFSGWIDGAKKEELLAQSDVFLLPSYNEGLPMSILEAMSWGLPVIASSVAGIPDIVREHVNGVLITPGNISQLTEAMKLLIKDETLRLRMGIAARQTAESFAIKPYCYALTRIYQSMMALEKFG